MTSLKTSIKTITYLSDIGCLEIQGASLKDLEDNVEKRLQNRQAKYQNEINQLSAPGVNFDDI
ncbi:hypothetical protein ESCOMA231M_23265 [Escherichia coli]